MLATRQPMAVDLRSVAMALKISNDLERIGDYATNIAKRIKRINVHEPLKPFITIPLMAEICRGMVKDVLDAYIERDARQGAGGLAARLRRSTSTTTSCSASC